MEDPRRPQPVPSSSAVGPARSHRELLVPGRPGRPSFGGPQHDAIFERSGAARSTPPAVPHPALVRSVNDPARRGRWKRAQPGGEPALRGAGGGGVRAEAGLSGERAAGALARTAGSALPRPLLSPRRRATGSSAIEVVRIRPQSRRGERVEDLIEDPWRRFECEPDPAGCVVRFEDEEFAAAGRDAVYYVRALQEPTPAINGAPMSTEFDAQGRAVGRLVFGELPHAGEDDCLAPVSERAWSSPIYVDFSAPRGRGGSRRSIRGSARKSHCASRRPLRALRSSSAGSAARAAPSRSPRWAPACPARRSPPGRRRRLAGVGRGGAQVFLEPLPGEEAALGVRVLALTPRPSRRGNAGRIREVDPSPGAPQIARVEHVDLGVDGDVHDTGARRNSVLPAARSSRSWGNW